MPSRGVSAGVVTITKYKPDIVAIGSLSSDFIHKPGYICIKFKNNIIFNPHFTPNLPNTNTIYTTINWINTKCGIDKNQIRLDNISESHLVISSMFNNPSNVWMIGDYNIQRTELNLYETLIDKFDLIDSASEPLCTIHSLYGDIQYDQQIDYIFSNIKITIECKILEYVFYLSDHYAIDAEY
jgi:hypothetical protein